MRSRGAGRAKPTKHNPGVSDATAVDGVSWATRARERLRKYEERRERRRERRERRAAPNCATGGD